VSDGDVGSALNSNVQVERDASIDDLLDKAVSAIRCGTRVVAIVEVTS
jgi:hypothetical protein